MLRFAANYIGVLHRQRAEGMRVSCFQCELRACGAFKPVSDMELAFINEMKRDHLRLDAGTEFIAAGQDQAELYTLYAGWAFRHKTLPDGRRQILNIHLPGDLIGLQGAMFEAPAYGVEALTEVQLCLLPRRKIWSLFENMPELSFDVTWLGAREESQVDEHLTSAGRRSAAERIAALVIMLYKRLDALGMVVNGSMPFPLTQQHIADTLGLSLVHTNKSLAKLRRLGMFAQTNGTLLLSNPRALESLAQYFDEETPKRPLI
jgi:CRP-like cAMP-binding protein